MTDEQLDILRRAVQAEIEYAQILNEKESAWQGVHFAEQCDELWQSLKTSND